MGEKCLMTALMDSGFSCTQNNQNMEVSLKENFKSKECYIH